MIKNPHYFESVAEARDFAATHGYSLEERGYTMDKPDVQYRIVDGANQPVWPVKGATAELSMIISWLAYKHTQGELPTPQEVVQDRRSRNTEFTDKLKQFMTPEAISKMSAEIAEVRKAERLRSSANANL